MKKIKEKRQDSASKLSDSARHKQQKNTSGHCSWCFHRTNHVRVSKHMKPARSAYQCTDCYKRTLKCRRAKCDSMARGMDGWDEEFCFVHKPHNKDYSWETAQDAMTRERNCSWCFRYTTHSCIVDNPMNVVGSRVYQCNACGRPTVKCTKCKEHQARDNGARNPECAQCKGLLEDWTDPASNMASLSKNAWCSWCFNKCDHLLMHRKGKLSEAEYECTSCFLGTQPCKHCEEGMSRGKSFGGNSCALCRKNKSLKSKKKDTLESWEHLTEKKEEMWVLPNSLDVLRGELSRDSEERKKAHAAGMIRPFLLLVSMHPAVRHAVGCYLGITLISSSKFGDSHKEAYSIIFKKKVGMIPRCSEVLESVGERIDWYDIVQRCLKFNFENHEYKSLFKAETIIACKDSANPLLAEMEAVYLKCISDRQNASYQPAIKEAADNFMSKVETNKEIMAPFTSAGLSGDYILRMVVQSTVAAETVENGNPEEKALTCAELLQNLHNQLIFGVGYVHKAVALQDKAKKIGVAVVKLALNQLVLSAIHPLLGTAFCMACFAYGVAQKVLGSSLDQLAPATTMIISQRLMLASQGIDIREFY